MKKRQENLDIFKLAFSDAVDSLVPALLNAMAATGESWAGIMVTALWKQTILEFLPISCAQHKNCPGNFISCNLSIFL